MGSRWSGYLIAVAAEMALFGVPAWTSMRSNEARPPARRADRAGSRVSGLNLLSLPPFVRERLRLTPDQSAGLDKIRSGMYEELRLIVRGARDRVDTSAVGLLRERAEKSASDLLTTSQRRDYAELLTDLRSYQGLGKAATALLAVKNISAQQKGRLRQLAAERRQTSRVRLQGAEPGPQLVQALQELEAEVAAAISRVLTPEQSRQFAGALRSVRPSGSKPDPEK